MGAMKAAKILGCVMAAAAFVASGTGLPSKPTDPPAQDLFNGRNLEGWTSIGDPQFVATNQVLRLLGGTGWLQSTGQYTNFVLELEWRALEPGYDSGVFIRAGTNGIPWPEDAWQVNLARISLGGLVKGRRTIVPAETPPMPLNTWVHFRIGVHGSKIWLDVDGERAWDYAELDATHGYIGIQAEGKSFDFRNIKITPTREAN
jgi:hypothetical protein